MNAPAAKVNCTRRPAIKPPPLGVLKWLESRVGARQAALDRVASGKIKPVCPAGQVPMIKGSPRGLPKGNPDRPRRQKASQAPAVPDQACDGVIYPSEPNDCYYYAGGSDSRKDQGGGLTTTIKKPVVVGPGHSLEEMSVQGGPGNGNIVEIGSSVSHDQFGDSDPHLFVFHWISWNPTCYSCNWQQWSNTYYPGMDLSSLAGHSVYNGYVYYRGNWWGWFNDQWVGYFPGSQWKTQPKVYSVAHTGFGAIRLGGPGT